LVELVLRHSHQAHSDKHHLPLAVGAAIKRST
jgi:hypothetical protein